MLSAGPDFAKVQLAMLWLLDVLGVPMGWKKTRAGYEFDWVGYHIMLKSYRVGLSASRANWVIRWITELIQNKRCVIGEFTEALGRMGFAAEALEYD